MRAGTKLVLVGLGGILGIVGACPLTPAPRQCWCGEEWRAQISGASAYNINDHPSPIGPLRRSA